MAKAEISYTPKETSSQESQLVSEDQTIQDINASEGIAAEQIIVKINDQGYVTSHGDHFHYYNGKVP